MNNIKRKSWVAIAVIVGIGVVSSMGIGSSDVQAKNGPPENNPGQPFAEMGVQHDMIKQDLAAVETNLGSQIQEVKDLVEALDGGAPCGAGPEGQRFVVNSSEVCDNTTGLYWQQTPGAPGGTPSPCDNGNMCAWQEAVDYCAALGNSYRLPEIKELVSLVDYSVARPGPVLPPGNPFLSVQSANYYSATTTAGEPCCAWLVRFDGSFGIVGAENKIPRDFDNTHAWCAR